MYGGIPSSLTRLVAAAALLAAPISSWAQTAYTFTSLKTSALLASPSDVALDGNGNLYVSQIRGYRIQKVAPDGTVSTLAGSTMGYSDRSGADALFSIVLGIATDAAGNVYAADTYNDVIRKITPDGAASTLAGWGGLAGNADGVGSDGHFNNPSGIALDAAGVVYVADSGNHTIRQVKQTGDKWVVSTLAGNPLVSGSADGPGNVARFLYPSSVAVDRAGNNLYVVDGNNFTIRQLVRVGTNWVVSTLAGKPGISGYVDGAGAAARFCSPQNATVDAAGNVYVTDRNNTIRKITPAGLVSTIGGTAGGPVWGKTDGTGANAGFNLPEGLTVDQTGHLYVADTENDRISVGLPETRLTATSPSAGQLALEFPSVTGLKYTLMQKSSLSDPTWSALTNWAGTGAPIQIHPSAPPGSEGFFRLRVE